MNDARMPADFVASERARDQEIFRREAQVANSTVQPSTSNLQPLHPRGVLTVEQAAARQAQVDDFNRQPQPSTSNLQPVSQPPTSNLQPALDPMLAVRLSLAAVLVLIVFWVWIKQRKK